MHQQPESKIVYLGSYYIHPPLRSEFFKVKSILEKNDISVKKSGQGGPPLWKAAVEALFLSKGTIYVPESDLNRAKEVMEQEGIHEKKSFST